MGWYIFGIISLGMMLFLLKNAYWHRRSVYEKREYTRGDRTYTKEVEVGYEYYDKIQMPLWFFIVLLGAFLTPILNVIITIIWVGSLILCWAKDEIFIHFSEKTIMGKIGKFFNKDIF